MLFVYEDFNLLDGNVKFLLNMPFLLKMIFLNESISSSDGNVHFFLNIQFFENVCSEIRFYIDFF